ncbi:MAG: MFS transporter, partial [Lacinutrix sp.]|uniref:MFS transporter n=1 Tax=Lacinutrix sp. TaxID=1937692 RepID=UPI0030AA529C
ADYVGNKKVFMKIFCYIGSLGCIGLFCFSKDYIHLSMFFYFMGLIGYWGSLVFYNSYLPDIAFPEQQDKISAKGFSLGYIGSVILLVLNLIMVMSFEGEAALKMMRYSFITVGLWWMLFSQYTFYILPKGVSTGHKVTKAVIFNGFRELKQVWKELKQNKRLKKYLNAFFVFSMAVQTIMLMATYFGSNEIKWEEYGADVSQGLIASILVIQLVAIIGAFLTSRASAKFGNIKTLIVINAIWMLLCFYAYFMVTPNQFYIAAGFVGLVMGGVQSLSRSTYSKFIPETEDTTSYFSFYDVAEKIGIVIGMSIFAIVDQLKSMRYAILFLFIFFLFGIILLFRVPKEEF